MKNIFPIFAFLCVAACADDAVTTLTVEPVNRQKITQWGVATHNRPDWNPAELWTIALHPKSLDAVYDELGTTLVRFAIDFKTYDQQAPREYLRDGILAATSRGVGWYGVPWSPPPSMKTINHENGAVDGVKNRLKPGYEAEVAKWLVDLIQWLEKEGVPLPVAIGPQNEPDWWPGFYPGCIYTAEQIQNVTVELRKALDAAGYTNVQVVANDGATPDVGEPPPGNPNQGTINQLGLRPGGAFETNATYRNALGIISTHTYDIHSNFYRRNPGSMQAFYEAVQRSGKEAWMSEWETRFEHTHSDWEIITEVMTHFNRDIAGMGFNGWLHWKMWEGFAYSEGSNDPGKCVYRIRPGDELVYREVDLDSRPEFLEVRISSGSEKAMTLSVHLDGKDGPKIGELAIPRTALHNRDFRTLRIPLESAVGTHDLHLVFSSPWKGASASLNWFRFAGGKRVEAEAFSSKSGNGVVEVCYMNETRCKLVHDDGKTIWRRPLFYIFKKIWNTAPADGKTFVRWMHSSDDSFQGRSTAPDPASYRQDLCAFVHPNAMTVVIVNRKMEDQTVNLTGLTGSTATLYRYEKEDAGSVDKDLSIVGKFPIKNRMLKGLSLPGESFSILVTDSGEFCEK